MKNVALLNNKSKDSVIEQFKKNKSADLLMRISHHLVIHSSFMNNLGLFNGKMGIVLFFAHLSRFTENIIYDNYASDLLDEICANLHKRYPVDFEDGLCGIGWGIEYLAQNGFMEIDTDDILSEIDKKIMEYDPRRITKGGIMRGLEGLSFYIQTRLTSPCRNQTKIPFDEIYISDWRKKIGSMNISTQQEVWTTLLQTVPEGDDITTWRFGLCDGCAGVGLRIMLSND